MKRFTITGMMVIIALLLFSGPTPAAESTMWVSPAGAQLKVRPSGAARTIEHLGAGTGVTVIAIDRQWYRVRTPAGREGWMHQQSLSDVQTEAAAAVRKKDDSAETGDRPGRLGGLLDSLPGSSISADSTDASRSIRGLSPEAAEYADQTGTPQQFRDALDSVLEHEISRNDIDTFLRQGKIGEYAE